MLLFKNWLETRWLFLFYFGFFVVVLTSGYVQSGHVPQTNPIPQGLRLAGTLNIFSLFWIVPSVMFAGAGIKTSAAFEGRKGLHGSMHFTLSLPVSRLRLLATRAGIGLLEMGVIGEFGSMAGVIDVGLVFGW